MWWLRPEIWEWVKNAANNVSLAVLTVLMLANLIVLLAVSLVLYCR